MKNLKKMSVKFYLMLALSAVSVLAGCKDDEEVVTPQFPDLKEQTVTLTETTDENGNNVFSASLDITFSANLDWTLKSDAAWCRFVNGEFKETTASGKAGDQTLKVEISDASWNYTSADVAQITLSMASQEQVIYKITRGAKQYQDLVVRNEAGEVLGLDNPLTIKGSGLREIPGDSVYTIITAMADMEVGVIESPSWLSMRNEGNGVFKLIFDKDNDDNISPINSFGTDKNYKLVIATDDYENSESDKIRKVEIPLSYEGLKADYVELAPTYELPLLISKDGCVVTIDNESNEEVADYYSSKPLKCEVKNVRNNEYRVLIFDKTDEELPTGGTRPVYDFSKEVDWFTCTKTETGFTVDQPGNLMNSELKERGVIVMVFSEDFCKEHENDWASALLDPDGYILPEYTKNTYAVFTQKDLSMSLSCFFEYNGEMIAFGTENAVDDDKIKSAIQGAICEDQSWQYMIAFDKLLLDNGDIYLEIVNYKSGSQTQFPEIPGVTVEMVSKDEKQYVKISGSLEEEMTEMQYLIITDGTDYVNAGIAINDSEKSETEPEV